MRYCRVSVQRLLNPLEEDAVVEVISVQSLVKQIANSVGKCLLSSERGWSDLDNIVPLPCVQEQLKPFAVSIQVVAHRDVLMPGLKRIFFSCQRPMRSQQAENVLQADIRNYLNWNVGSCLHKRILVIIMWEWVPVCTFTTRKYFSSQL